MTCSQQHRGGPGCTDEPLSERPAWQMTKPLLRHVVPISCFWKTSLLWKWSSLSHQYLGRLRRTTRQLRVSAGSRVTLYNRAKSITVQGFYSAQLRNLIQLAAQSSNQPAFLERTCLFSVPDLGQAHSCPFRVYLASMLKFQDFSLHHGDPNPYAPYP